VFIVMRSVNANLFEINQAKSRIKAAEAAGQTPSADDVASRSAQAAVLKAIKAGSTTVDLAGGSSDDGGDDNGGSGGSGGSPSAGSGTGGNQQTTKYTQNISSANTSQGTVNTSVNKQYAAG